MTTTRVPRAMTIAGSDSGGGAGIQADLKTFGAMGVFGTCAITTITAQNTIGVDSVLETPTSMIEAQIDAIVSDIGADAVKTGMLSSSDIIRCVAGRIEFHSLAPTVIDPVMVASTGFSLLRDDAVDAMRSVLVPMATVVTPNSREARVLTELEMNTVDDLKAAARILVDELGAQNAVVKGGHLEGPATDVLYDGSDFVMFTSERIDTPNTHGTGCTLASAIAAGLAKGLELPHAVQQAKDYVTAAIRSSFPVGRGHGPLNHFHELWRV
jgi:hydroxymethylpyrimidine/phosphomethylpyrimidine kinase